MATLQVYFNGFFQIMNLYKIAVKKISSYSTILVVHIHIHILIETRPLKVDYVIL